jgi:anion-transporting  ArsA/GET3 family ATPase
VTGTDTDLLSRRLLIVTGKGGVGKTTLAATLGVLAARRGIDTVVIETGRDAALPPLLAEDGPALEAGDGRTPVRVSPHLYTLHIDPEIALTEYLELQVRVRALVRLGVRNAAFQRLLDAAPGWRELITLGKIWHLQSREKDGAPLWPLCIVDAPSTGHGLSLLSVPHVVLDTVRLGPLRRHTDWVQALIRDPERTLVVPVTLLEELPVKETAELVAAVRELGIAVGPLFANGVEPAPGLPDLDALLGALPEPGPRGLPPRETLRTIAEHSLRRYALQRDFLTQIQNGFGLPVLQLPQLLTSVERRDHLETLASVLEPELDSTKGTR